MMEIIRGLYGQILAFFMLRLLVSLVALAYCQKIRLRDIQALTLREGEYTTYKRTYAVPQLVCVGSICPKDLLPQVVQCQNVGWDGQQVQWKCVADMDNSIRFKETTVICEGYSRKDDEFVLVGSCGLEYSLTRNRNYQQSEFIIQSKDTEESVFGQKLVLIIIVLVLMYLIYNCLNAPRNSFATPVSAADDGGDTGGRSSNNWFKPPEPTNNIRPGFWTGLGLGGVLGGLLARNRANRQTGNNYVSGSRPSSYSSGIRSSSIAGTRRRDESSSSTSTGFGGSRTR